MKFSKEYSPRELSYFLDAELILRTANVNIKLYGLKDLFSCTKKDVVVFNNTNFINYLNNLKAGLIVLKKEFLNKINTNCLIVENPRLALAKLSNLCFKKKKNILSEHTTNFIGNNVTIHETAVISNGVVIGDNCVIGKMSHIGFNTVLYDNVTIGKRCNIGSNSTIGSEGFGFVKNEYKKWEHIFHFAGVIIGNDISIGSNTCIDKGVFLNTVISDGVLIDNSVQIAHNVFIGKNTVIAGCVGIGGSTYIGNNCLIGGGAMISDHLFINDNVFITGSSTVTKSLNKSGLYSSVFPAINSWQWNKNLHYFYNVKK